MNMEFIPLCSLSLLEEEADTLYHTLRIALERMLPNNMVDASDYEVLTVFPFKRGECSVASDDYEVENYQVGMYGTWLALCKMGNSKTLLVLGETGGVLTALSVQSSCPIPKPIRKNATTSD